MLQIPRGRPRIMPGKKFINLFLDPKQVSIENQQVSRALRLSGQLCGALDLLVPPIAHQLKTLALKSAASKNVSGNLDAVLEVFLAKDVADVVSTVRMLIRKIGTI